MSPPEKKPLGKILLQQRLVTQTELNDLLKQRGGGERLATRVAESGLVDSVSLLKALSEQHGVPGIDLEQVVIPLTNLDLVPREIAEKHTILPILVRDDAVFLAMADPKDARVIDELEFVTAKKVFPYVALHGALQKIIAQAYEQKAQGLPFWRGENVPTEYLEQLGLDGAEPAPAPVPMPTSPQSRPEASGPVVIEDRFARAPTRDPGSGLEPLPDLDPSRRSSPIAPSAGKKILVVDDEEDIRRLVTRVLEERGYEVVVAANGLDALRLIKEEVPDMLVLDAMLPEVHGFDICRRIKRSERYGHIPVIMISAVYRGWRFAQDLRTSYGVDQFIEKPFRIADLTEAVDRLFVREAPGGAHADRTSDEAKRELETGMAKYRSGDLEGAIAHLRRGVEIDPLSFQLHYHLALLLGKQGLVYQAIQELETSVSLVPDHFLALKNLAVLYQKAGFKMKSVESWERALAHAPDDQTRQGIKDHLLTLL